MRQRILAVTVAAVLTLSFASPAHAADTTPPTAPGTPVASDITDNGATLTWAPSTDDVAVANYEVWDIHTDIVARLGTPTATTFTVNTLGRGTVHRLYIVAVDTSGNRSQSSPLITLTTLPGDLEPPGPVLGLAASEITDTSVRLTWQGVWWGEVDIFRVFQGPANSLPTTLLGTVPFTSPRTFVVTGLTAGTQYRFGVSARDAAGNENSPSTILVTTTGAPTPPTCTVAYRVQSQWATGFVAEVKVTNIDTTAISPWSLAWTFANGQQILNLWQGTFVQTGGGVTVTNLSYNATIPAAGGSQAFGFLGTSSAVNTNPNVFTLNGRPCQAV